MIAAIWLGSAVFLMLAANAAFRAAPDATAAADVVGAMLTRWHYIALAAPLLLFALELRRVRRFVLVVLFGAVLLAAAQVFVDLQIRAIRGASIVPVSSLDKEDPVRRRFGALHGASMLLLLLQAIAATVAVAARQKGEEELVVSNGDDTTIYQVIENEEQQYTIWAADRELPAGWSAVGFQGPKEACAHYIEQVWTNQIPPGLRSKMDGGGGGGP